MHIEEQSVIHNFVLSELENISVLLRFPWELLLNPPSLPPPPSFSAVLFLSTGAAFVQVNVSSLTIWRALLTISSGFRRLKGFLNLKFI